METLYSPDGNAEVWESKKAAEAATGLTYYTPAEWRELHPISNDMGAKEALAVKQAEILRLYEQALLEAQRDYPAAERQGWPAQEAEARALRDDPEADCPVLAALARLRGMDETTAGLGEKVLRNAEQWRADYAYLTGTYQRLTREVEAMAEAGASGKEILAHDSNFALPRRGESSKPSKENL